MEINIFFLIKIGKKEYMHELHQDGVIFMNDVDYFRRLEGNGLRGDKDEGIIGIEQVVAIKLIHNGKLLAHGNSAQLKFHDYDRKGNIYSLMAIISREELDSFHVDAEIKRLGDSFVIITNVKNFTERIENKLKELKFEYEYGLVKYYESKKYSGPLDVFYKPDRFKYQKEFRFFVKRNETGPLKIKIGSIKDISYIFDITKLDKIGIELS